MGSQFFFVIFDFNYDLKPGALDAGFQIFTLVQISIKSGTQILYLGAFDASSRDLRHTLYHKKKFTSRKTFTHENRKPLEPSFICLVQHIHKVPLHLTHFPSSFNYFFLVSILYCYFPQSSVNCSFMSFHWS